jgi:glucose/arabinose dehydrogenase
VLLGKMLRIDVNGGPPYGIPPDNPFIGDSAARPEIWAYGLRNPWRYSFDRATGDLYIADVGQNRWEWLHHQPGGAGGGQNYGWNRMEGGHCFPPGRSCDPSPFVSPIAEYPSSQGCSIIGGFVYRGPSFPQLDGFYFFGDYCSGRVWAVREHGPADWRQQELLKSPLRISSFGEDEAGDVYLTSLSDNGLYRLVAAP